MSTPHRGQVRAGTSADLVALQRIEAAADQQFAPLMDISGWGAPATGDSRAAQAGFVLVVGEPVAGFAHVLDLDGHLHLEQLAVDPAHGRRGLGSALLEEVCRVAASRGAREVTLMTFADVPWNGPWYAARASAARTNDGRRGPRRGGKARVPGTFRFIRLSAAGPYAGCSPHRVR